MNVDRSSIRRADRCRLVQGRPAKVVPGRERHSPTVKLNLHTPPIGSHPSVASGHRHRPERILARRANGWAVLVADMVLPASPRFPTTLAPSQGQSIYDWLGTPLSSIHPPYCQVALDRYTVLAGQSPWTNWLGRT